MLIKWFDTTNYDVRKKKRTLPVGKNIKSDWFNERCKSW